MRADAQAGITYPVLDNNTLDRTRRVAFNTQPEKARNAVTPRAIIAERVPRQGRHTLNVTVPEGEEDGTARTSIFDITADFGSRFSVYPSALGFEWDGVGDPDFLRPYLPDDITASIRSDNEDAVLTFVSRHPVRWRIEGVPLTATLINARGQEYDLLPNATDRGLRQHQRVRAQALHAAAVVPAGRIQRGAADPAAHPRAAPALQVRDAGSGQRPA